MRHPDIKPGRKVYYCLNRSTFAYTSAIKLRKGNDASNIHDEEVGEDELDFSDDEKEADWKRRKGKG
jgi:H/ACA ribonucleoprotein complex non-core subunit NAF1